MQWSEQDAFWEEMSEVMFGPDRWARAPSEVDGALALAGFADRAAAPAEGAPGLAVLDMPCGPGRHSLELARRGARVTGVDRTSAYLDDARDRARVSGLDVEWLQADMRGFRRPGGFDLALNLYSSFGYFDDPSEDWRVLENLRASLRPGGVLVMDMKGKEVLARDFQPRRFLERGETILLERAVILGDWTRVQTDWVLIQGDVRRERTLVTRLYSAAVLRGMLLRTGFASVEIFGAWSGAPYDHRAERLIAVARVEAPA